MRVLSWQLPLLAAATAWLRFARAIPTEEARDSASYCQKTKVAVLGAGTAGIFAAQALSNQGISDFMILEYNGEIGGRVKHKNGFGKKSGSKDGYTIELGANWVQGIHSEGGPTNPIWTLAKKYKLQNHYSNYSNMQTFTEKGADDFLNLFDTFETAYSTFEQNAGYILTQNLQDSSIRTGMSIANWKPTKPTKKPKEEAVEWFEFDFEYGSTPEQSSHEFAVVNFNTSFYQWSDENNFVTDDRGFNAFIVGEAGTFLKKNDPRLMLNTIVTGIAYSDTGVVIKTKNGKCIQADYAINTFSVGVLQSDVVKFEPALPDWKQSAIEGFTMATYTKIFLQFPPDKVFWDQSKEFFLYADPVERGYYPTFQSLDTPGFLSGSGIIFVTVVQDQSYQVENQPDSVTKDQVMTVLRDMFGHDKVPDPIAFFYPRWSTEPWAYGSYSNWPVGYTLEKHENLRASVGRLWFAGEATSAEYYGFLQGAYYEGKMVGTAIAQCIKNNKTACNNNPHYEVLHGTTDASEYSARNGWTTSSFLTYGFEA